MENEIQKLLKRKFFHKENIQPAVEKWKREQQKIVFTNGCFDLLHPGHLNYLMEAAQLGDKLLIGLNSDTSVKRLKGSNRPVNDEQTRAAFLASLFFVDAVVLFSEDTPLQLIDIIKPDVLVKGGDYTIGQIVGAQEVLDRGGSVKTLNFIPGYSTTQIIQKIQAGI